MIPTLPISASLIIAIIVQVACQVFKVILYSVKERRLNLSYFVSAGGMPSAHSAFVTALSTSIGLWNGFDSELFAVSFVFSVIIIYDAFRLRGAVGQHARALSMLLAERPDLAVGKLTRMVGHTLGEIVAGIVAGGGFSALVYFVIRWLNLA